MNKDQKVCIDWLVNTDGDYLMNLIEMEGCYQSVPDKVCDSFAKLSSKERIEVVYKSAKSVLKK